MCMLAGSPSERLSEVDIFTDLSQTDMSRRIKLVNRRIALQKSRHSQVRLVSSLMVKYIPTVNDIIVDISIFNHMITLWCSTRMVSINSVDLIWKLHLAHAYNNSCPLLGDFDMLMTCTSWNNLIYLYNYNDTAI